MVAGGMLISVNNAILKSISTTIPLGEVICLRALVSIALVAAFVMARGRVQDLRVTQYRVHLLRGVLQVGSMFLFIGALRALPLVDAMTLVYIGPLIITALAPVMLGERVGWHRWSAVLIGFAGVVVMLRPGGDSLHWAAIIPVGAAFLGALRDIITRRMSAGNTSLGILFYTSCIVALVSVATLPFGWEVPSWCDIALIVIAGAIVTTSLFLLIEALRFAQATTVSPFRYVALIWAGVLGFLMFGEVPDVWTIAGGSLIVIAGIYLIQRETRRPIRTPSSDQVA
tara:strand:+ start:1058 stop:1912 length:855 start_codon:yes stop_codon:yes gene_type:complete